jgi:hypothetical protein
MKFIDKFSNKKYNVVVLKNNVRNLWDFRHKRRVLWNEIRNGASLKSKIRAEQRASVLKPSEILSGAFLNQNPRRTVYIRIETVVLKINDFYI